MIPLFYILTWLSIQLFGESEFTVRLPALFAGILGIALTIQIGKTLKQPWLGLWAAFLVLSPYHLKYSQEARHYTLLMALSLLSYILLVRAMKRPSWRMWLMYAVVTAVNLYTHYGAFVVLATQATIMTAWGVWQAWQKQYASIKYIPVAAALVLILYLPWVSRLLASFQRNVGQDLASGTGPATTLSEWLRISFHTFALYDNQIYAVLPFLIAFSFILWLIKRQWAEIVFLVTSLALPFLLIQILGIARGAYARYVIYTFPFLLLLVAIIPTTLLWPLSQHRKKWAFLLASSTLAITLALMSQPFIQREHEHIAEDWRGIPNTWTHKQTRMMSFLVYRLVFRMALTLYPPHYLTICPSPIKITFF
ncbi:MAG: glycosyltransferase family 39 protein [Chloroflexi bacterium]|nr:glycosyltransferase family 39 protein [Chloroflexota bacterium]